MKASSAVHRFMGKVLSLTMSMKHACKTDSSNISFHVRSNRERRRLVARFFVEGLGPRGNESSETGAFEQRMEVDSEGKRKRKALQGGVCVC